MKKGLIFIILFIIVSKLPAQNMEKMQWFNEPQSWKAAQKSLTLFVTPKTDYWRITHYGFTVDDGPFYYSLQGGEFEAKVKITGEYKTRYDQMGLMLRIDETTWIKTGIDYVDEVMNVSAVVTNEKSDWSVLQLTEKPKSIWVKAVRRLDAVEISYSLDDRDYKMIRLAYFPAMKPVMVGMVAASPDGDGFNALFEGFEIKHLPDANRLKWLENNK
jgi:regulation of enolase protein 1 (concanavalin A-like superfamily)